MSVPGGLPGGLSGGRLGGLPRLEVIGVPGLGEITAGDDLAGMLLAGLAAAGLDPRPGDILVISSKVVSKAQGRTLRASTRDAAIEAETVRVLAERRSARGVTRVVQSRSGPVLAAAGVDASNVPPGTVLLLPEDPDAAARDLRHRLAAGVPGPIAVLVSDTAGRAWRDGQVDLAIGAAGVRVTDDLRGATDGYGNALEVTVRALVDELASAADLVKGKLAGVPVAVIRGLADLVTTEDGPGAAALLRSGSADWFAHGHVEAVRTALGVPAGTPGVDPVPVLPDDAPARLRRAVDVATVAPDPFARSDAGAAQTSELKAVVHAVGAVQASVEVTGSDRLAVGALVQRILAACWAEGLTAAASVTADAITVRATLP
jgi:coenzyme F420-0:L-glutamate ligase/coenzyme F420-1:gamma-L-glutamate ligase